jgi:virulence factor
MSRELRVGVVGGGNIAQVAQLPALAARDDTTVAGIVTRTQASAERNLAAWPIERGYPTAGAMIESARLDALFVLTPRLLHADFVEQGLLAGLHVFCEKPLGVTADDAVRLADLADREQRLLAVGFNRRHAPVYQRGRAAFGEGRPDFCVAQKNRSGSEYRATFENAIHMVDLLRWYCGEATTVTAHAAGDDRYEEDGVMALIRFDTGATGVLVAARTAGSWDERLDAYGNTTSVRVVSPDSIAIDRSNETHLVELRPKAAGWVNATSALGFRACVDDFLDAIHHERQLVSSGREAARTQQLLDRILACAGLPLEEATDREWTSHAQ